MDANAQLMSTTSVAGSARLRPSSTASAIGAFTHKCSHFRAVLTSWLVGFVFAADAGEVGHQPLLPDRLLGGPFTVADARKAGLRRWHLEENSWSRVGPSTYVWSRLTRDPMLSLVAALRRLPHGAAFSGRTAAWLH